MNLSFFLVSFLAIAVAQLTQTPPLNTPVTALGTGLAGPNPTLLAASGGSVFFDVTASRAVRITRLGAATNVPPIGELFSVRIRAGGFRAVGVPATNAANWTLVSFGVVGAVTPVPGVGAGATVFLIDVTDFVLPVGTTGVGLTFSGAGSVQFVYEEVAEGTTFGGVAPVLGTSAAYEQDDAFSVAPVGSVLGAHEPNVIFEFADPITLELQSSAIAIASATGVDGVVDAGIEGVNGVRGDSNLVFQTLLHNLGFEALTNVDIRELLTLPQFVGLNALNGHSFGPVTGCVWRFQSCSAAAPTPPATTLATAIGVINAANGVCTEQFTPGLSVVNIGPLTVPPGTPGELNGDVQVPAAVAGVGAVYQIRTSVFVTSGTAIGIYSTFFNPLAPTPNIQVFVDGVAVTFAAGLPNTGTLFYTSNSLATIPADGVAHNIRIVAFLPVVPPSLDLEIFGTTVAASLGALDQNWNLLQPSNGPAAPAPSFTAGGGVPPVPLPGGIVRIPALCVGGTIRVNTTIDVGSDAAVGEDVIQQSLSINTFGTPFVIAPPVPSVTAIDVEHQYELAITKSTTCDTTIESLWTVSTYKTTAAVLTNNETPFQDFDDILAISPPVTPDASGQYNTLDFGGTPFDVGSNGAVTEFPGFPFAAQPPTPSFFFVRATGRILISPAGLYTIATVANRGVRVKIDGQTVILRQSIIAPPPPAFENFETVSLTAGVHDVVVDYYDVDPPSILEVFIAPGAEPVEPVAVTPPSFFGTVKQTYSLLRTVPSCMRQCDSSLFSGYQVQMWYAESAQLNDGTSPIADIDALVAGNVAPNATACGVKFLNFQRAAPDNLPSTPDFFNRFNDVVTPTNQEFIYPLPPRGGTPPLTNFYFRATGAFFIAVAGNYTIGVSSNRGIAVRIDGQTVILEEPVDDNALLPESFVTLNLQPGAHTIEVLHYYGNGGQFVTPPTLEVFIATGGLLLPPAPGAANPFLPGPSHLDFKLLESALECQLFNLGDVVAGQNFTFTLTVQNRGPSKADRIVITDTATLNSIVLHTSSMSGPFIIGLPRPQSSLDTVADTPSPAVTSFTWTINNLRYLADNTRRLFVDVFLPSSTPVTNLMVANSRLCNTYAAAVANPLVEEILPAVPAATVCENVTHLVDLGVQVTQTATTVVAGRDTASITVKLTNNGPSDLTAGFALNDLLTFPTAPAGSVVAVFDDSGATVFNPMNGQWTGGSLVRGASETLRFDFDISRNATAATDAIKNVVSNVALAPGASVLERLVRTCDDKATNTITITREFDLLVTKVQVSPAVPPPEVVAGQAPFPASNLRYRVNITNLGPSDASTLQIVDTLVGAPATGITVDNFVPTSGTFATSLCNGGTASSWRVRVWKSDAATLTTGVSQFEDVDALVNGNQPTVVDTTVPVLDFEEASLTPFPAGTPAEFFVLQATGTLNVVTGGLFTFAVVSETGVRITIDNTVDVLIEPTAGGPPPDEGFHTLNLTAGAHTIAVSYYALEDAGSTQELALYVAPGAFAPPISPIFNGANSPFFLLRTAPSCLFSCSSPLETQWRVNMYQSTAAIITGAGASAFEDLDAILAANQRPNATGAFATIDFDVANPAKLYPLGGAGISNFFFDAKAQIFITDADTYTFRVETTTGARLSVDGRVIVLYDPDNFAGGVATHSLSLSAGPHDIRLGHYGSSGSPAMTFKIAVKMDRGVVVPTTLLRTSRYCQVPTWSLTTLPVGASASLDVTLTVGPSAQIGTITNNIFYAIATAPLENIVDIDGRASEAQVVTNVQRNVTLSVTKVQKTPALNAPVVAGSGADNLQYVVTIVNNGPSDTRGVNVSELLTLPIPQTSSEFFFDTNVFASTGADGLALPAGQLVVAPPFTLASPTPPPFTGNGQTFWSTVIIPAGRNLTLTTTLTVRRNAFCRVGNNTITNAVSVQNLLDARERLISATLPPVVTTTVNRVVDMQINVTSDLTSIQAQDLTFPVGNPLSRPRCVVFTVDVKNRGFSNIDVVDIFNNIALPHDVFIHDIASIDGPPAAFKVPDTLILQGDDVTLRFGAISSDPTNGPQGDNTRQAKITVCTTSAAPEVFQGIVDQISFNKAPGACEIIVNTTDDSDVRRVSVTRKIDIALTKTKIANPDPAIAGDFEGNVPFRVTVVNNGPSDASDVVIADRPDLATTGSRVFRAEPGRVSDGWDVEVYLSAANITTLAQAGAAAVPANLFTTVNVDSIDINSVDDLVDPAVLFGLGVTQNVVLKARTQFFVTTAGTFTFALTAADGGAVSVDGAANTITIDGTRDSAVTALSAPLALVAGAHNIDVLYFWRDGPVRLRVQQSPGAVQFFPLGAFANVDGLAPTTYTPLNAADGQWTLPVVRSSHAPVPVLPAEFIIRYTAPTNATTGVDPAGALNKVKNTVTFVQANEALPATVVSASGSIDVLRLCNDATILVRVDRNVPLATAGASLPGNVVHTVVVRNVGPSQCDNIEITTTANVLGATGVTPGTTVTVQPKFTLASGATKTIPIVYDVSASAVDTVDVTPPIPVAPPARLHVETSAVITDGIDPADLPATPVSQSTEVQRIANIVLTKTANVDTVRSGATDGTQQVTYSLTFTNNGPSVVTNVVITDTVACGTGNSAVCVVGVTGPLVQTGNTVTWSISSQNPGQTRTQSVTVAAAAGTATGVDRISNTASINTPTEPGTKSAPVTVLTAVAPFDVVFAFNAFEQGSNVANRKRSVDDVEAYHSSSSSSSSSSSDSTRCSSTSHPAEHCTRLLFLEVTNTATQFRATDVKVSVTIDNVALAEALLTQSSRDDVVVSNGGGTFTWTIGSLQAGQRTRLAFKVRTIAEQNQLVARIEQANACLPTSTLCFPANALLFTTFTKIL